MISGNFICHFQYQRLCFCARASDLRHWEFPVFDLSEVVLLLRCMIVVPKRFHNDLDKNSEHHNALSIPSYFFHWHFKICGMHWSTYIIRDFSPVLKAIGICDGSQQFRQLFYRFNNPDFRRGLFVLCIILFIVPDIYFNYIYTNHWFAVIGKKASLQRLNDLRV